MSRTIFLAFVSADRTRSDSLRRSLEAAGYKVTSASLKRVGRFTDIKPVIHAVDAADALVAILTARSLASAGSVFVKVGMAAAAGKPRLLLLQRSVRTYIPIDDDRAIVFSTWNGVVPRVMRALEVLLQPQPRKPRVKTKGRATAKTRGGRRTAFQVVPSPSRGWQVVGGGKGVRGVFGSKSAAISAARALAGPESAEIEIRGRDGRVQQRSVVKPTSSDWRKTPS